MAYVAVNYVAPGGYQFTEQRDKEPSLGDVVMIGADQFVVRMVIVPDFWTAYGDVSQYRSAQVILAYQPAEAS